jgi:hypothetical protein
VGKEDIARFDVETRLGGRGEKYTCIHQQAIMTFSYHRPHRANKSRHTHTHTHTHRERERDKQMMEKLADQCQYAKEVRCGSKDI